MMFHGVRTPAARSDKKVIAGHIEAPKKQGHEGSDGAAVLPTNGAASFQSRSYDGKLSAVRQIRLGKRRRLIQSGPLVCSTYVSIEGACSDRCPFKSSGCFVQSGSTIGMARKQDDAARGHSAIDVIVEEVALIDKAFARRIPQDGRCGGRDLRLHVGGDVGSIFGAQLLSEAARRWRARGGGAVWAYTHNWREIPRSAWGSAINVLASVERAEDIEVAQQAGYAAAIVIAEFPSRRAFRIAGSTTKLIPCPAETNVDPNKSVTCASCRLCLDHDLLKMNAAIVFEAHGPEARKVRERLAPIQIRRNRDGAAVSEAGDPGLGTSAGLTTRSGLMAPAAAERGECDAPQPSAFLREEGPQ